MQQAIHCIFDKLDSKKTKDSDCNIDYNDIEIFQLVSLVGQILIKSTFKMHVRVDQENSFCNFDPNDNF